MKTALLLAVFICSICQAQTMTQSLSQEVSDDSYFLTGCHNYFFRSFVPTDYGVTYDYEVNHVEAGVNYVSGNPGTSVLKLQLYSTQLVFPAGFTSTSHDGYALLAEQDYDVANEYHSTSAVPLVSFPITAIVPANNRLVVVFSYDASQTALFMGMNTQGETAPSYIMAPDCGSQVPGTFGVAGANPESALIINVLGGPTALGIEANQLASTLMYPNPTYGLLHVTLPFGMEIADAALVDVSGKTISLNIQNGVADLSQFADGLYLLSLRSGSQHIVRRVLKE
jgi:hypothetical protein